MENADKLNGYVERIERLLGDLDGLKSEHMNACKAVREDIAEIYAEAKDNGINKKALKGNVTRRTLERKIEAIRENMEPEDQDDYDTIRLKLGDLADTPLGQAALGEAGEEDVRPRFLQEKDSELPPEPKKARGRKKSPEEAAAESAVAEKGIIGAAADALGTAAATYETAH